MMPSPRRSLATLPSVLLLVFWCGTAAAQFSEPFKNLKVLPKTITKRELQDTMRGYSRALGVHCEYCHVEDESVKPTRRDFASDDKLPKQAARLMMQMTLDLNAKYVSQVKSDRPAHVEVSCITCHHGQTVPRTIDMVLSDVTASKGLDAAVQEYRGLREKYYGAASFDFTEAPLDDYVRRLTTDGKTAEAQRFLDLAAEYSPKSSMISTLRGEILLAGGDKEKAIEQFKQALALDPNNQMAKRRLDDLEKPEKPESPPNPEKH
jgi:tetratricopeptide (TPR) repeat protein